MHNSLVALALLIASLQGIDKGTFYNLITEESRWDHTEVSEEGCYGLMQLNPMFFPRRLYRTPEANLTAGAAYLAELLEKYDGDYRKALCAYNWGPRRLDGAIQKYGPNWWEVVPFKTQRYIERILQ